MSEEFKCPYCEGTASIAYHRTGNNLLYCHDCKRTFSERDAKIMKQAARIAELEAERNRLREALNEFLDLESPYSLLQVMETLSDAAELLLNQYGYDGPEYELIQHAIDHGKGIREKATVQRKLMGQTICQN